MNAFDPALFSAGAPCLPCCSETACACALLIPAQLEVRWGNVYGSYATATAQIASYVSNCIGYGEDGSFGTLDLFTATNTTPSVLVLMGKGTAGIGEAIAMTASLTVPASTTLTVAFIFDVGPGASNAIMVIYDCATGDTLDFAFGSTSPFTSIVLAAGTYILEVIATASAPGVSAEATFTITADTSFVVNPVIALWDDSGTTRSLWACPKLLLPPLTEATGDWYANCADASDVLTSTAVGFFVSNCVGYTEDHSDLSTFTATDGGTSLTFDLIFATPNGATPDVWGGFNAVAGQTISVAYSDNGTGDRIYQLEIYDDAGVSVEIISVNTGFGGSSPLVSAALPYTGRYTIRVLSLVPPQFPPPANPDSYTFVITSSGTFSVNPIQALYDVGLDCPARLDCGDACP